MAQQINFDDLDYDAAMQARREKFRKRREDLQAELAEIDKELRRVEAYFNPPAELGTRPVAAQPPRTTAPTGREPQEGMRKQVIDLFKEQGPLFAGQVLEKMGSDNKETERAIRSALHNLLKQGRLMRDAPRGQYYLPDTPPTQQPAPTEERAPAEEEAAEEELAPS